jgi:hypothetical protein
MDRRSGVNVSVGKLDCNRLCSATAPLARRRDNSVASEILGPAAGHVVDIGQAGLNIAGRTASAADVHKMRLALPLQNLMFVRRLFDQVEAGAANAFGIAPRRAYGTR